MIAGETEKTNISEINIQPQLNMTTMNMEVGLINWPKKSASFIAYY